MENFIVSARKYRPATFNTVVGQSHITGTLKNAIKTEHLAQAFLFCGPRGVGKTTCARILAKTINCTSRTENIEACNNCDSCKSFNEGASLNVFELDAASNNSVDDIRTLTDQVRYAPQIGKFKVYVIDEVHMLSNQAFNAFLKTLEEPPKHAIFILATTEKHKIIPTILSRCQIFDFNRIQIEDIASHLAFIAKEENINAEADALHIIAQKADGALRDACSIFDQIVSFAGNTVTYKNVIDNLNILDYDYYFKITDLLLQENIGETLLLYNEILNNGFDGHNFVAGLGDHLRNLLVGKDESTLELLEVGNNIRNKYREQSLLCSINFIVRALTLLSKADVNYKSSKNQRLLIELSLMQICSINSIKNDGEKKNEFIKQSTKFTEIKTTSKQKPLEPSIVKQPNDLANHSQLAEPAEKKVTENKTDYNNNGSTTTIAKKIVLKTSSPSLNEHLNGEKKSNELPVNPTIEHKINNNNAGNNFTQEELEKWWNKYANDLKSEGKANLGIALSTKKPVLRENHIVDFTVSNKAMAESIAEIRLTILDFLRAELKCNQINLNLIMTTSEEKNLLYTANDRYKRLSEKNSFLPKFKQAFELDVDF